MTTLTSAIAATRSVAVPRRRRRVTPAAVVIMVALWLYAAIAMAPR